MNTKETLKEPLESGSTDIVRRIKKRSQATRIASAVAGGILAVLPVSAKAETSDSTVASLGTPFSQEINDFIWISSSELQPQLIPGIATDEFKMTFGPVSDYADVYATGFQIQDSISNNGVVIQQLGAITPVPEASDPTVYETSYLEIDRGDNQVTKILNEGSVAIYADGKVKWDGWYSDTCNPSSFDILHPSRNKDELKILVDYCGNVYRVPLGANDYCKEKVLDTQESNKAQCIYSAPETKELLAIKEYIKATDMRPGYLLARKPDGTLFHLKRSSDGTWTKENPQKGTSDFAEWDRPLAMLERETPNGREITILVTNYYDPDSLGYDTALKALVLEKQPESTDDNPVWKEVPVAMTQDPTIIPGELDSDGDGVKNGADNCPGAKNPDQLDLNGDGYGDACASADCKDSGGYPWEAGAQTTTNASGLTVCKSDLVSGFSAYVQSDQSMIHSDKDVVLDSAGNISAQSGQTLVYVHTQKAGTEALPAKNMIFPAGNSVELEIYSTEKLDGTPGTATLNYTDFLGQPVEVKFDGPTNWKSEGVIVGGELGIEGCYYKAIVGDENVVVGCPPVCNAELPMPQPEPMPEPAVENVAELPTPQPEPVLVVETPMPVAEVPASQSEAVAIAEIPMLPAEPVAEPASDVVESPPETDAGSVIIPPIDTTVSSPEVDVVSPDTQVSLDAVADTAQNPDTPPVSPDTPTNADEAGQSNPDTPPISPDTIDAPQSDNTVDPDTIPVEGGSTDVPVQSADSEKPQPLTDASSSADTTDTNQPKPESPAEKGSGGGGCSCAIENPNDPSALNALMMLGAGIAAWVVQRRKRMRGILEK